MNKLNKKRTRKPKNAPIVEQLSPRVLYSADPLGLGSDLVSPDENSTKKQDLEAEIASGSLLINDHAELSAVNDELLTDDFADNNQQLRTEIVFVDTTVANYQQIIDSLVQSSDANVSYIVHTLHSSQSIDDITNTLATHSELDAIHFITHGEDAQFRLGSSFVNSETVSDYTDSFTQWGEALAEDGDILFYGCNLAESSEGQQLVATIADSTNADVGASDNRTGHESLNADWRLEYSVGQIDTNPDNLAGILNDWESHLASITVTIVEDIVDIDDGLVSSVATLEMNPGTDGEISLREAIIAANRDATVDVINLPAGTYTLDKTSDFQGRDEYFGDLDISNPLTIIGAGSGTTKIEGVSTEGVSTERVIEASSGGAVSLSNLTITGGVDQSGLGGGGIFFQGNELTLDNVNLIGNQASTGGGLYVNAGNVEANNVSISNNRADLNAGGVFVRGFGTIEANNLTITENTAQTQGGGIYVEAGDITANDLSIIDNNAGTQGGGIFLNSGKILAPSLSIFDNDAGAQGGGLFVQSGTIDAQDLSLSINTAGAEGGGLYVHSGEINAQTLSASGNTAGTQGGGLYVRFATVNAQDGSSISGNVASDQGGGIFVDGGTVNTNGVDIINNTATNRGAGLFINDGRLDAVNTTISNNNTTAIGSEGGGAYVNNFTTLTTYQTTFESNSAQEGGGVHLNGGTLEATQTNFIGNGNGSDPNSISIIDGGAIYNNNGNATIERSLIQGNKADSGGGVYIIGTGTTNITDSTLADNTAEQRGSAVWVESGNVNIVRSTIADNTNINGEYTLGVNDFPVTPATVSIEGSLIARNTVGTTSSSDIDPDVVSLGHNLTDTSFSIPQGTDREGEINTGLAPDLANNGGFVDTYRLLADSPAIDAGAAPDSNQVFIDATGAGRDTADIGAYEFRQAGVNDGPTVIVNQGLIFTAGSTDAQIPLTSLLSAIDPDHTPENILFELTTLPDIGNVVINGVTVDSFTQQQLDDGVVFYEHNGATGLDSFNFRVTDGEHESTEFDFPIIIYGNNTAPILAQGAYSLSPQSRVNTDPAGTSVADLLRSNNPNPIEDPDTGDLEGIAVTSANDSGGTWEFKADPADTNTDWLSINSAGSDVVSDENSLLLKPDSLIRFVPDTNTASQQQQQQQQTSGLMFRAHDFSIGRAAGEYHQDATPFNSGLIGNVGPHSSHVATASVSYIPELVNDVPTKIETDEDEPFALGLNFLQETGRDSRILVSGEPGGNIVNVSLQVINGTLELTNSDANGNLDSLEGNNTSKILLKDTLSDINFALQSLIFTPDPGYHNDGGTGTLVDTLVVESWVDVDRELYLSFDDFDNTASPGVIFDDNAGTSNNGDLLGDATIRNGNHLDVRGAGGVEIASGLGITDELTFATWLQLPNNSSGNRMDIISIDGFGSLYYDPDNEKVIGFFTEGGSDQITSTDFNLNDGNRHHIAYTVDSNTNRQSLYIDGVLVEITNHNHADNLLLDNSTTPVTRIGDNGFFGKVDDVHIFSRALAAEEILAVHDDGDVNNENRNNVYLTQDIDEINIIIHPLVEGPTVVSLDQTPLTFTENGLPLDTSIGIIAEQEDGNDIQSAVVTVSNFNAIEDLLSIDSSLLSTLGISETIGSPAGTISLEGAASAADYQAALRTITYQNISENPSTVDRTISYTVESTELDSDTASRVINVISVNDRPQGSNGTIGTNEDTPYTFLSTDFGFRDIHEQHNFAALVVNSLPASGTLTLDGVAVIPGQVISITDINNGKLVYTPAEQPSSLLTDSWTFSVRDNGDTNKSGNNTSIAHTMTMNIELVNDAPVLGNLETNNTSYIENSAPVSITNTLSLIDIDDAFIESATVTITDVVDGVDILNFTDQSGISGSYNAITGVLSLTGSATATEYQTALRSVTYENTSENADPATLEKRITIAVNDGDLDSNELQRDINIVPVNDPPQGTNGTVSTDEDIPYTYRGTDFGFNDTSELDSFAALRVNTLPASGTLMLNGSVVTSGLIISISNINNDELTYQPVSNQNGVLADTWTFNVIDNGGTDNGGNDTSAVHTMSINIDAKNDAPLLSNLEPDNIPYTENSGPISITNTLALNDIDNTFIESATITLTNYRSNQDVLDFDDQGGVLTGTFTNTASTITLTINGSATANDYQNAIRSITYENTSNAPSAVLRDISISVNDGELENNISNIVQRTINVIPVNDAPQATDGTVTTNEDTPYTFLSSDFGFNDIHEQHNFAKLIVDTLPASGTLTLLDSTVIAGQTPLSSPVEAGDVISITDINNGKLEYTPALQQHGTTGTSWMFSVVDTGGGSDTSDSHTMTISIDAVNDAPSLNDTNLQAINEDDSNPSGQTVSNIFAGNFTDSADVTDTLAGIAIVSNPATPATGHWEYLVSGSTTWQPVSATVSDNNALLLDTNTQLRFNPAQNYNGTPLPLLVKAIDSSFNSSFSTLGQSLHENVQSNNTDTPFSNTATLNINVVSVNDAPSIADAQLPQQIEDTDPQSPAQIIDLLQPGYTDSDFNGPIFGIAVTGNPENATQGTWQYSYNNIDWFNINSVSSQSALILGSNAYLKFNSEPDYHGPVDPLQIKAIDGEYDTTQPVTIDNSSRVRLNTEINTNNDFSTERNVSVVVQAVNDAPEINNLETTTVSYQENSDPRLITNTLSITDEDNQSIESATVSISDNFANGEDVLEFASQNGITGVYNTVTGILTLSGNASIADYDEAIRSITYQNNSEDPSADTREITIIVSDGNLNSSPQTRFVNVIPVNDRPEAIDSSVTISEDDSYSFELTDFGFMDIDNHSIEDVLVDLNNPRLSLDTATQRIVYTPIANSTLTDQFTFSAQDSGGGENGIDISTPATMTVNIESKNDAPSINNATLTATIEDNNNPPGQTVAGLFGSSFSDADTTDTFSGVAITENLESPTNGQWQYATTNGGWQIIGPVSSTNALLLDTDTAIRFRPSTDYNGTPTSLQLTAIDSSYTGSFTNDTPELRDIATLNTSVSQAVLLNTAVTAVNDAPIIADASLPAQNEDTTSPIRILELFAGYSDADTTDSIAGIAVTDNPATAEQGTWQYLSVGSTWQNINNATNSNALVLSADSLVRFVPVLNFNGTPSDLSVRAIDATYTGGTTTANSDRVTLDISDSSITLSEEHSISIEVLPINDAPQGTSGNVTITEDTPFTFTSADFGFNDPVESHNFAAVTIDSVTTSGLLTLNGLPVSAGQLVSITSVNSGDLVYTPASQQNGASVDALNFSVHDDGDTANNGTDRDLQPNTLSIDITSVNDAPTGSNKTLNTDESTAVQFTLSDFGFSDTLDQNSFQSVLIESLPLTGELLLGNSPVSASEVIGVTDIANGALTYIPASAKETDSASFDFKVTDDGGTLNNGEDTSLNANTIAIQIGADNNPPTGSDQTHTLQEDDSFTLAAEDFGFADAVDGHSLAGVIIAAPPANGNLTNNGDVVSGDTFIDIADINAGNLQYTPTPDDNGTNYATIEFKVVDNGKIDTGNHIATNASTLTFNVAPVNDEPTQLSVDGSLEVAENSSDQILGNVFFSDADIDDSHQFSVSDDRFAIVNNQLVLSPGVILDFESEPLVTMQITVTDSAGATAIQDLVLQVLNINEAPVQSAQVEDQSNAAPFEFELPQVLFTDVDSDDLQLSATLADGSPLPEWLEFNPDTGAFIISDDARAQGQTVDTVVTATDSGGLSATSTLIQISVEPAFEAFQPLEPVIETPEVIVIPEPEPEPEPTPEPTPEPVAELVDDALDSADTDALADAEAEAEAEEIGGVNGELFDASSLTLTAAGSFEQQQQREVIQFGSLNSTNNSLLIGRDPLSLNLTNDFNVLLNNGSYEAEQARRQSEYATATLKNLADVADKSQTNLAETQVLTTKVLATSATLSSGISVGYILWLLRGGTLLASVMASMPAWRAIDPLPILESLGGDDDDDTETLESMVETETGEAVAEIPQDNR